MLSKFSSYNEITKTEVNLPKQFTMVEKPFIGEMEGLK